MNEKCRNADLQFIAGLLFEMLGACEFMLMVVFLLHIYLRFLIILVCGSLVYCLFLDFYILSDIFH